MAQKKAPSSLPRNPPPGEEEEIITVPQFCRNCLEALRCCACWNMPLFVLNNIRLFAYSMCLLPGFLRCGWFYATCDRRVEKYKEVSCRNYVDIYGATTAREQPSDDHRRKAPTGKPVLLFFPGGAWLIGYKMWGALVAKAMVPLHILVIIPDYRNYPWAHGPGMVQDVDDAIGWAHQNCARWGGNPDQIVLFGESAGGHLCMCALLRRVLGALGAPGGAEDAATTTTPQPHEGSWEEDYWPQHIKGMILLSSPFDLHAMKESFSCKGINPHLLHNMFGPDMSKYDPQRILRACDASQNLARFLPPVKIFHGTADKTVPWEGSQEFHRLLQQVGIPAEFQAYEGWSHTDPNLESIMDEDHRFHQDLYRAMQQWTECGGEQEVDAAAAMPVGTRLCHPRRIQLGRWWNPF